MVPVILFLLSVTYAADDWVHVPGGYLMHKSCIFEVPHGQLVDEEYTKNHTCEYGVRRPDIQTYVMDAHLTVSSGQVTQMNCSWNVPSLPTSHDGQTLYYWPGFKSTEPEMMLPVLQPVLQYGQQGASWYAQSWFVWGNKGISYTGPAVRVSAGDMIDSYMIYDQSSKTYVCYCIDRASGRSSYLSVSDRQYSFNQGFKVAMVVNENIYSQGRCSDYPASGEVTFSGLKVNDATPTWTPRHKLDDCGQKVTVLNNGESVKMQWHN